MLFIIGYLGERKEFKNSLIFQEVEDRGMMNDIYNMLNNADINLDEYKKEELDDLEKRNFKANFRKSIKKKKYYKRNIIAAGIAIVLTVTLFGTNMGVNALTSVLEMPQVQDIASFFKIRKNLDEYKTVVNKAITDNGITIQLNEVILDGNEINVSFNISSTEKFKNVEMPAHAFGLLYINNEEIMNGAVGGSNRIDEHNLQEVITYDLGDGQYSGDLDVKIRFFSVEINGSRNEGQWDFEFKTNGDELKSDTREIALHNKITFDNGEEWTLEKYTDNSVGQKIYVSVSNHKEESNYSLVVSGVDDLNHYVRFSTYVVGDKDVAVLRIQRYHDKVNENAKKLTLTPYQDEQPHDGREWKIKQIGEAFNIDLSQLK
jgi:hypothetical protein